MTTNNNGSVTKIIDILNKALKEARMDAYEWIPSTEGNNLKINLTKKKNTNPAYYNSEGILLLRRALIKNGFLDTNENVGKNVLGEIANNSSDIPLTLSVDANKISKCEIKLHGFSDSVKEQKENDKLITEIANTLAHACKGVYCENYKSEYIGNGEIYLDPEGSPFYFKVNRESLIPSIKISTSHSVYHVVDVPRFTDKELSDKELKKLQSFFYKSLKKCGIKQDGEDLFLSLDYSENEKIYKRAKVPLRLTMKAYGAEKKIAAIPSKVVDKMIR